ncbi:MAG: aminotransferase class V-fold PLP-dependent enzyme [Phycisphaerales bacterium]|nr:aminotransferase class V-fold PLP-dependent enzyme [Phycisphaerales bacterium]
MSHDVEIQCPEPLPGSDVSGWMLSPELTFLNHGSFGARSRHVHAYQEQVRTEVESSPVSELVDTMIEALPEIKSSIAGFVGADPNGIGLVQNASEAMNAVVRSIDFDSADEIVATSHGYGAVLQLLRYVAQRYGLKLHEVDVSVPVVSPRDTVQNVLDAMNKHTRLVVIDHITSSTGLRMDVETIVGACRNQGIDVLVDGAHAPGMVELDITALDPTWYVGNLHKWVCAPIGAGFLWSAASRRDEVHPAVISHGYLEGYAAEFDWQGTRDMTAWRCVPHAIEWMDSTWGWDRIRAHNHALACWAHQVLSNAWGVDHLSPLDGSLLGSMATLRLPEGVRPKFNDFESLQRHIRSRFGIEVPIFEWNGQWLLRVSAQVYNRPEQYMALADAILEVAEGDAGE